MKLEVKELKKLTDLLTKGDIITVNIYVNDIRKFVEFDYVDLNGNKTIVRLNEEGSGMFSKITKEELF